MSIASRERALNGRKPPSVWPVVGEIEELLLGGLDLLRRGAVEIVAIGVVDHVLADGDELAAQMRSWMVRP